MVATTRLGFFGVPDNAGNGDFTADASSAPSISSVVGTVREGASVVINGTNFGASQGDSTLKLIYSTVEVEQTASAWADTQITFTVTADASLPFGSASLRIDTGDGVDTTAVTHATLAANDYVVADVPAAEGDVSLFDTASPPVVDGDQCEWVLKSDLDADITVRADGTFVVDSDVGIHSLQFRLWDESELAWSAWFAVAVSTGDPAFVGPSVGNLNLLTNTPWTLNFSTRFNDVTPGDVLTYSLDGAWPDWATISPQTGIVSGTPDTPAAYTGLRVGATDLNAVTGYTNTFSITVSVGTPPVFAGPDIQTLSLYEGITMQEITAASLFTE